MFHQKNLTEKEEKMRKEERVEKRLKKGYHHPMKEKRRKEVITHGLKNSQRGI